jgi:hypothetical protein
MSVKSNPSIEVTDFVCSPERKKKNELKLLREKDQREWLKTHNTSMHALTEEQFRQEQIHRHILEGNSLSADPHKQCNNNLMFTAPVQNIRSNARGNKFVNEVHRTARFPNAVEVLQKYDKDNRWAAGINANTLMTEYRRKVILNAFGYENIEGVQEAREDSQIKVKKFMQEHWNDLLDEPDKKEAAEEAASATKDPGPYRGRRKKEKEEREITRDYSLSGKHSNFIAGSDARVGKGSGCTVTNVPTFKQRAGDSLCNFRPKFDDYDVMRNRFKYIKPEITALLKRQTMAPESISRQVFSPVSRSVVTGSFSDVLGFEDNQSKAESRRISAAQHKSTAAAASAAASSKGHGHNTTRLRGSSMHSDSLSSY